MWRPGLDRASEHEPVLAPNNPHKSLPLARQRQRLPIFALRAAILFELERRRCVVLVGETGSGKTTQVPQYLLEAGWAGEGRCVACTQPRRVAAMSVADRVAQEVGCELGTTVGYAVRFAEKWSRQATRVKYCTDGMLVRETLRDPLLSAYSVIMLDETHERSLHTDVLLGLLKKIMRRRPELRVVVASATLDAELFRDFFEDAAVLSVEGRQFPVDVLYAEEPVADYVRATVDTVREIHRSEGAGDVLAFLPGQEDVEAVVRELREGGGRRRGGGAAELVVLPLFGALPAAQQLRAFRPVARTARKVVVATNIAETSLTIGGVAFVVDCGFAKLPFFNPVSGLQALVTMPTSKASAAQRAGRAGRVRAGKCFRLYPEAAFAALPAFTVPEMQRADVTWAVLQLKALGIHDVLHFDYVSPPAAEALERALELLCALGAIEARQGRLLEPRGLQLAEFPVEPRLAAMLLASLDLGCAQEALTVAAALSVRSVFASTEHLGHFAAEHGDHLTLLNVYDQFRSVGSTKPAEWCREHGLDHRALQRVGEVRAQLEAYLRRHGEISSCGEDGDAVRRCVVAGFFSNAARLAPDGAYRTVRDDRRVEVSPQSVFAHFGAPPPWVVFHEIALTSAEYMRDVTAVSPRWLVEMAPSYYESRTY